MGSRLNQEGQNESAAHDGAVALVARSTGLSLSPAPGPALPAAERRLKPRSSTHMADFIVAAAKKTVMVKPILKLKLKITFTKLRET